MEEYIGGLFCRTTWIRIFRKIIGLSIGIVHLRLTRYKKTLAIFQSIAGNLNKTPGCHKLTKGLYKENSVRARYREDLEKLSFLEMLTLKAPITTAADDKFCDIFPNFRQK